jgi:hypothetical protein
VDGRIGLAQHQFKQKENNEMMQQKSTRQQTVRVHPHVNKSAKSNNVPHNPQQLHVLLAILQRKNRAAKNNRWHCIPLIDDVRRQRSANLLHGERF